jgi:hemerythrin-like metal-binding protein
MEDKGEFFKWTEKMSVGSIEIDSQHKILVGLLNELYQAFLDRDHKDKVGTIIERMAEYAKVHFDTEEKYFAEFSYSDAAGHNKEHQQFREKVNDFMVKYKSNSGALTYDVMNFLRNWLTNHIMFTDQKYMECFLRNGVL